MTSEGSKVLVVDDDRAVRAALGVNLRKANINVILASNAEEALNILKKETIDLVLTDVRMPGMGGLALLEQIRNASLNTEVVVMTGYGNVDDAVSAMKLGAADYIIKPISKQELLVIIERTLESRALKEEVVALRKEVETRWCFENIIGNTPPMQKVFELVHTVADTTALVLILGETGTGKELISHAIHHLSPRREKPFVKINCAALPDTLLESELFGHERGSFTGAIKAHMGRFEQAKGGTIFLDEIGEISPSMQAKLLHIVENGQFQRLGGRETLQADVRIIAATNKNLQEAVEKRRFRKDLYYRLNVFTIQLPPLRERMDDIPLLANNFLKTFSQKNSRIVTRISKKAISQLMDHSWPGNVRELKHTIERAVILSQGEEISSIEIEGYDKLQKVTTQGTNIGDVLRNIEQQMILDALKEANGIQAEAARKLGISRSNLHYRLKKLNMV